MQRRSFFRLTFLAAATAALVLVLVLGLNAPQASAQSLDDLRASGAVGERFDGYAQALQSSAAGTVDQVNAKRRQIYADRAASEGVPPDQIGRVYAKQIFSSAPPGTKFLQENGAWITK
jgi:uncharacterized protein YdbL (DUF1318 family)